MSGLLIVREVEGDGCDSNLVLTAISCYQVRDDDEEKKAIKLMN